MTRASSLAVVLALFMACSGGQTATSPPGTQLITVVATTTVFGDLVKQVGGNRVDVHALVPKGGEVHTFDPAPSDATKLTGARLLVLNGLGLDDWLLAFAEQAGAANVPAIELGEGLEGEGLEYISGDEDHEGAPENHRLNPHLWLNVEYARLYVDRIRLKLIEVDPSGQQTYDANARAFDGRLVELDAWVRQQMEAVPAGERRVVSFHDAFPYFAAAYDLEIVGVVVAAPGQDPSAAEVAALVSAIQAASVKAILAESQFSDELAQTIAAETGATVVGQLYTDSLGDPPVDSYEAAMRYDVEQIAAALR